MSWETTLTPEIAERLAKELAEHAGNLHNLLSHSSAVQGTSVATLAEMQGAELIEAGATSFHGQSLYDFNLGLVNNLRAFRVTMQEVGARDFRTAAELREVFRDLRELAGQRADLAQRTLDLARDLFLTSRQRLSSVPLFAGARTNANLVTSQLRALGGNLSLVPNGIASSPLVRETLEEISELPISVPEAARKSAAALAAARGGLSVFASRAAASPAASIFRAALQSLWTAGSRLILMPIIVVDQNGRVIGLPSVSPAGPDGI